MPLFYLAFPCGQLASRLCTHRASWRTCTRHSICALLHESFQAGEQNFLCEQDVKPSWRAPTLADAPARPVLCADMGAAASPVRPAAGRSLAPGPGAPLPWRRSAHNKAEQGRKTRACGAPRPHRSRVPGFYADAPLSTLKSLAMEALSPFGIQPTPSARGSQPQEEGVRSHTSQTLAIKRQGRAPRTSTGVAPRERKQELNSPSQVPRAELARRRCRRWPPACHCASITPAKASDTNVSSCSTKSHAL